MYCQCRNIYRLAVFIVTFCLFSIICLLNQVRIVTAQEGAPGLTMQAEAAFAGRVKYGEWLPIWITLANDGANLNAELRAEVRGGAGAITYAMPVVLPAGSRKRVPLYVIPNSYSQQIQVALVDTTGNDLRNEVTVPVDPQPNVSYFIGVISREWKALTLLSGVHLPDGQRTLELVNVTVDDLPDRAQALRSFDMLILNDVDTSSLHPEQSAALTSWVAQGGHLVIGGGPNAATTIAGVVPSLLPFQPTGLADLTDVANLALYAGAEAIRIPGPFVAATGEVVGTQILVRAGELPLLIQHGVGKGTVSFSALDLATAPFDGWSGTAAFWTHLVAPTALYPSWLPPDTSPRQVRADRLSYSLSNLPSLDLPSIQGLSLLLGVYIVLVGPGNYLFLRWRRRLHWAWLTIPLLTIAFSAGAFGLGYALRGNDLILNKIALIEPTEGGSANVSSYMGLFSPTQQNYEITVAEGGLVIPMAMGYGPWDVGRVATGGNLTLVQGTPATVRGLSVNQWSMQTFMTESRWDDFGDVVGTFKLAGDALTGQIENATAHDLTDVVLVVGGHIERVRDLAPGATETVQINLADMGTGGVSTNLAWQIYDTMITGGADPSNRTMQNKQQIVTSLFETGLDPRWSPAGTRMTDAAQPIVLLGWLTEAPPTIRVSQRTPTQQTIGLLYTTFDVSIPATGDFTIPVGMVPGRVIVQPVSGGLCGEQTTSAIYLSSGHADFEFRLPQDAQPPTVQAIRLSIREDGPQITPLTISLYHWPSDSWTALDESIIGLNEITQLDGLLSDDGHVRVRVATESDRNGCTYLALGLTGTR